MADKRDAGMTFIVKTVTRLTLGFILLYGIYIAVNGHNSPGGGFAGGVIVALSFIHIMLAFGKEVALKKVTVFAIGACMACGALGFLSFWATDFYAMATLPLSEVCVIGAGLFAVFVALVLLGKGDVDAE